jgi:hypothetical protein
MVKPIKICLPLPLELVNTKIYVEPSSQMIKIELSNNFSRTFNKIP